MKIRRDVLLVIGIPLIFVLSLQFILALTIPQEQLEEKITLYDINYVPSDFEITDVFVGYLNKDELQVDFYIIGGDDQMNLRFKVFCQDINHQNLVSASAGQLQLLSIGSAYTNSSVIAPGNIIMGSFLWENVPAGTQRIRLYVSLDDIYLDTWTFSVELR